LQRLIDEELEQRAANHANITVTPREIDDALNRVAQQNQVSVDVILDEATKSGLTEASYRQELRRQLLETKLLSLRTQGRLRVSDDDVRAAYAKLVTEERKQLPFRAAWIRLGAPRGLTPEELRARREQAEGIVAAARAGEDFGELARKFSEDAPTRLKGGTLGELKAGQLPPALDSVLLLLEPGAVSEPIRHGDDFVILKLVDRDPTSLPPFDKARDELMQRVYMEKVGAARRHWIDGLKRQTHVEVRL
jgi:peptidyl-prolyl cis-trans isomerase SurA